MTYFPATIEDVSTATAALIVAEELTTLREASPAAVFDLLRRRLTQAVLAYLDALNNWSVDD
jgi:hypothetical protein